MSHRLAGAYLAQRTLFGMKFGLGTMRSLVEEMGHPERAYPSLLVAGTNGKGSVAAYCDSVLRASGLRTGRYTSPHLVRVNERITVDGRPISDAALGRAVVAVRDAAGRLVKRGVLAAHPTFFEALTAAALVHFARARVDVAVLEVGLGGRLDATNVADPLASAIVSVDLDHQTYLGTTLRSIATEKAGVMRRGRATVLGPLPQEARAAIAAVARERGARLVDARRGVRIDAATGSPADGARPGRVLGVSRETLDLRTPERAYRGLKPLPGAHQKDNLLVALRLLEEASHAGLAVDLGSAPRAVARTRWPGRLQGRAGPAPGDRRRSPAPPRRRPQPGRRAGPGRVPRRRPAVRAPVRGDVRQGRARPGPAALPPGARGRPDPPEGHPRGSPGRDRTPSGRAGPRRPPRPHRRPRPRPGPPPRPRRRRQDDRGRRGKPLPRRRGGQDPGTPWGRPAQRAGAAPPSSPRK